MSNFDESKHPRDGDGKFTNKNGGESSGGIKEQIEWARKSGKELPLNNDGSLDEVALNKMYSEREKNDSNLTSEKFEAEHMQREPGYPHDAPAQKKRNKSYEEFFGEEFKGFKGAAAIDKLLQEKRGHIKNAFERAEIGGIDLVWGDNRGGLSHAIEKRDKLFAQGTGNISGLDMAKKIPEIIENGKFYVDNKGRINIEYNGYRVGILPSYYEKKLNWIVTAMEIW